MTAEQIAAWRAAAVADGWTVEPTYGQHESADSAATLKRDGFHASVILRGGHDNSLHAWGPDRLQITVPAVYSWEALQAALRICMYCGTAGDTERVSFAGRCCAACLPAKRKELEYKGWTE